MRTNKAKRTTRLAKNGGNNVLIQRPPVLSLDLDFAADVGCISASVAGLTSTVHDKFYQTIIGGPGGYSETSTTGTR
jgi:hypothetical protein